MSRRPRIVGPVAVLTVLVPLAFALAHFRQAAGEPINVDGDLWTDKVKKGAMEWDVRGVGTLVPAQDSSKLIARVTVPDDMAGELRPNQKADLDTPNVKLKGCVIYITPWPSNGRRSIDIAVESRLLNGVGARQEVDATIHLGTVENILYVVRPIHANQYSIIHVFKVVDDDQRAIRVNVKFGRASVNTIEVLGGLKEGDKIIPSDMSAWDNFDQIRLK